MKKLLLVSFLLLFPLLCRADFDLGKWRYYKDIEEAGPGTVRFDLDDQVYDKTNYDYGDLRVIDSENRETPFILSASQPSYIANTYAPTLLNSSFIAGVNSSAILDFGENPPEVNRLTINTGAENFQRNVSIYGSQTNGNWRTIKTDAYIFDFTDRRASFQSSNTTIDFPKSVFRYLKIVIDDSENAPVEIASVTANLKSKLEAEAKERTPDWHVEENPNSQTTLVFIDLGAAGIPSNKAALDVTDKNFNRSVTIFGSNDNETWRGLDQDNIFRIQTAKFQGEKLELNYRETNDRYLKLVVQNYDDQPIEITGLKVYSINRRITYLADENHSYRLYYGSPKAKTPQYDLKSYIQYLDLDNARTAALSSFKYNTDYVDPAMPRITPKSETVPYLLSGALMVATVILLFLVFRFFRK